MTGCLERIFCTAAGMAKRWRNSPQMSDVVTRLSLANVPRRSFLAPLQKRTHVCPTLLRPSALGLWNNVKLDPFISRSSPLISMLPRCSHFTGDCFAGGVSNRRHRPFTPPCTANIANLSESFDPPAYPCGKPTQQHLVPHSGRLESI
jgi:hypothetical protein